MVFEHPIVISPYMCTDIKIHTHNTVHNHLGNIATSALLILMIFAHYITITYFLYVRVGVGNGVSFS